ILWSCGKPELCADEIFKDRSIISADGAMRFIADNQLKIRGRELRQESIACSETLNRRDDYLRLFPILPSLFVNDRLDSVIRQVIAKISLRLFFQFQSID